MTEIFLYIVNMSITATILAVVVLFLRLLLKKAPKWISVLLWGLVALRLICPFAVESPFSLMPKTDWVVQEPLTEENFFLDSVPDTIPAFDALAEGKITITDLDRFNIRYCREPKQGYEQSRLITVAEVSEEALLGTEYYEYIHDQNEYTRYILIRTMGNHS